MCYADTMEFLERLPRATFALLDVAGHNLPIEQPVLFEAMVTDCLARIKMID
ncbi:hypothetical protein LJC61_02385 [Ruminococcaceae bacterium OttesenSCG-928-A16]|nr:hypothetical protein [Ruminococcaceae bacterium OttesenSCG-928-A16]